MNKSKINETGLQGTTIIFSLNKSAASKSIFDGQDRKTFDVVENLVSELGFLLGRVANERGPGQRNYWCGWIWKGGMGGGGD